MGAIEVLERIAQVLLNYYGITKEEFLNKTHKSPYPRRRIMLCVVAHNYDETITDDIIAKYLGIDRSTVAKQRSYYTSQINSGFSDMAREYRELCILTGQKIQTVHLDIHNLSDSDLSDIREILRRRSLFSGGHRYELEVIDQDIERRLRRNK